MQAKRNDFYNKKKTKTMLKISEPLRLNIFLNNLKINVEK